MALAELGIDPRVAAGLEAQGITSLYPPQEEAWHALKDGGNVLVAIPTASGKSLIAYLAILHRWLATGKKALYIVPLRALASEKFEELSEWRHLGLHVAISTGDLDDAQARRLARADVIVCTSEKADALLRHRTAWVQDIGCVVADEVHLVHDAGRGPTLEVILSRFRALLPDAQIVGLSATIANADRLAAWLGASLVHSEWRPVDLRMATYCDGELRFLDMPPRVLPAAGEPTTSLVLETIAAGGQCLVFVSTRRSAESQAQKLAGPVREVLPPATLAALEAAVEELDDGEGGATNKKLRKLCTAGVAYHTAGLDAKQRRFVEAQFRAGNLKVLCATPTLAAGVNTPARRVIIRDLSRFEMGQGNRPLPVMEVKQMMGRAGRPRYDPHGEAVLLVKNDEHRAIVEEEYLRGPPEPVTSKLAADAALRIHLLSTVAGGYADSSDGLLAFVKGTFWAQETDDWILRDRLDDVTWFLEDRGFLERDGGRLRATLFGKRTSDLYIDPLSALRMKTAMEQPVEPSEFGILSVLTGCPDVYPLYLRRSDDWVQERFWRHHEELLVPDDGRDIESALAYAKTAFLLADWMQEHPLSGLEELYQVGPGDIRMRIDNSCWMLHAFQELSRSLRLDWTQTLQETAMRLEAGVKPELLPILRLKGIGRVRARTLHKAGFGTIPALRAATVERIARLPGFGTDSARNLLDQVGGDIDQSVVTEPEPVTPSSPEGTRVERVQDRPRKEADKRRVDLRDFS